MQTPKGLQREPEGIIMPRRTDEYAQQLVEDTARELHVDPAHDLSATEAGARLQRYGYNQVEEKEEPL
jgi:H+-transporting ATPase